MLEFMKRIFSLLLIIAFASHFGIIQSFAQKRAKPREVIFIEFTSPTGGIAKWEVIINRSPKTKYQTAGGGASGAGVSCSHCSQEYFEELRRKANEEAAKKSYGFTAKAWRMGKDKSNVNFAISTGGGECQTQKTFTVYRNRQTKLQLKCGISLTAYYGFESKKAN